MVFKNDVGNTLLNFVSPPKCIICNKNLPITSLKSICGNCFESIKFIEGKTCCICGRPVAEHSADVCINCKQMKNYYIKNIAPFLYKDGIKEAIQNMKFKRRQWIAIEFGKILSKIVLSKFNDVKFDTVAYVPMTKLSEIKRGFNQSYEIAYEISKALDIPLGTDILRKKINTKTQSGLTRKERLLNVKDAFSVAKPELVEDKIILLTDDVFTTGATLNECSKMLKKAGALAVYTTTVAMTVLDE